MGTEAFTVKNNYDTIVSTLAAQDQVPWYQKPNLRRLYATFIVSVLCVEVSLTGNVTLVDSCSSNVLDNVWL